MASADPYLPGRIEFKHTNLLNLRQEMLYKFIRNKEIPIRTVAHLTEQACLDGSTPRLPDTILRMEWSSVCYYNRT